MAPVAVMMGETDGLVSLCASMCSTSALPRAVAVPVQMEWQVVGAVSEDVDM